MSYISFQPKDYFNTHLYSGNDTTNNQQVGLTPDLVWVKCRNSAVPSHYWVDKVRGDKKYISSNATTAEQTDSNTFDLVSGGFNLAGGNGWTNVSGRTYCAWNWKGGGAGSSNTDGSINTTYTSANTTSGFSISTYTGTGSDGTIGHGLGVAPKFVMVKSLSATTYWMCYHAALGNNKEIYLNANNAASTSITWNTTTPTSSVISLDSAGGSGVNVSGQTYVCYAFAEKKGFSKFGSYTGNGNADGTFVYTGFKPAFVLTKKASASDNWVLLDNKRDTSPNPHKLALFPNLQDAQSGDYLTDFLSNGFKIRSSTGSLNSSGADYIYIAFAEEPLVSSNNIPATAR